MLNSSSLAKSNQKLSQRLENFEERLSLETTKLQVLQDENKVLKDSLNTVKMERDQLQKLLDQNFGMLSNFWNL